MKNEWKCFPLTLLLTGAVWVLCLMPVPETELGDVPMIDKWTHVAMYGVLTLTFAPIAMSGVLELLQAYCTGGNRSGEWLDFAANTVGVAVGYGLGRLVAGRKKN